MPVGNRRTVYYVGLVLATTVLFTVMYNVGMATLENRPQPLYRSLEVVVQSFTTTGYGEDAPWTSPWMNGLTITMQLTGIGLILAAVDVFAVPWLRDALTPSVPETVSDLDGHVVVCGCTPRTEAFVTELEARDEEYVIVEPDETVARDRHEEGYRVITGDPESTATLERAALSRAVAVVADVSDEANASIALATQDAPADCRVITLVEDGDLARYHRAAGADTVLSPRQLLGENLAEQVVSPVRTNVEDALTIGDDLELVEVPIGTGTDLDGQSLADVDFREAFGVSVIGAWHEGDFESPVDPTEPLTEGTRLLVAGSPENVAALRQSSAPVAPHHRGSIVVAGFGESGRAAWEALDGTESSVTVLDVADDEGVDVVGDARDPDVLEAAGVPEATTLVLTVGDDRTAIFTTLIARELNEGLRIVVRANEREDVTKLHRAGADYVQSLAVVSGRMLASTIFDDETVLAYAERVNVVRLAAGGLAGSTIADAAVRSETGATVVAVVRDGVQLTDFDPHSLSIETGDAVVLAGTDEAITAFERRYLD